MEYLLNEKQVRFVKKMCDYNEIIQEKMKKQKYNVDNVFNNEIKDIKQVAEEKSLIEVKNQKWYEKAINFIRSLFNKK